jgi:transposase
MRFAAAIQARFGVRYDPDHVGRIMHRLGLRERRRTHRQVTEVIYASRYSMPEAASTVA